MSSVRFLGGTLCVLLAIALLVAMTPTQSVAQDEGPGYQQVRTMVVKTGRVPEYLDLQKQLTEAEKAAGRSRGFWQEIRGNGATFYSVRDLDKLGDNDAGFEPPMGEDDWNEWLARLTDTMESTHYMVLRSYPELEIPADEGTEFNLLVLRERTVMPGKNGAYHEWIQNDLMPALKAGGLKGFGYNRVVMGANTNTWYGYTLLPNWSVLDGRGPLDSMDKEDREAMLAKGAALLVDGENRMLRYRADLSY